MHKRVLACLSLTFLMVIGNEIHASTAQAGLAAVRSNGGTTSLTTVKWGAVAGLAPTDASTGSFTVTGVTKSTAATTGSYFTIRNVGTIASISIGLTLTTSGANTYTTNIHECVGGTWNEANGACTGGVITLVRANTNAQSTTATWTKTINPSSNVRLRLQYVSSPARTVNATISLTMARTNIRTATNTSS